MKYIAIIIFAFAALQMKAQVFIHDAYYFIGQDQLNVYKQEKDILYNYNTFSILQPKQLHKTFPHYKVMENIIIDTIENIYAVKLEQLDKYPNLKDSIWSNRFSIYIYKKTENEIIFLNSKFHLTKSQFDTFNISSIDIKDCFGITYYNQKIIDSFSKLKKIETKADVDIILNELKKPLYNSMAEEYKYNACMQDLYAAAFMGTILKKACLSLGYNPIGAGYLMDILASERYSASEQAKMLKYYYEDLLLE